MKRNYTIYFEDDGKRNVIENISTESLNDLNNRIEELKKSEEYINKELLWDYEEVVILDENGNSLKTFRELTEELAEEIKNYNIFKKIYYWCCRKWHSLDIIFNLKCAFERLFFKYDRRVLWNIDTAVFDLLKYAIPKYVKNLHGCPLGYIEKARKMLTGMSNDELEKSFNESISTSIHENEVAIALYKADLNELLENIRVVEYYDNYGEDNDVKSENWVDPNRYPIPYHKNSKNIDYDELNRLREEKLDKIFNYLRYNLRSMWD